MRLIDADALARSHCVECTYYHTGKCLGKECDWDSIGHIRDAKTIDAIPIDFIDQQIDHYRQLFEESLYKNDDYDEKARMMVDTLTLLKRRWKQYDKP